MYIDNNGRFVIIKIESGYNDVTTERRLIPMDSSNLIADEDSIHWYIIMSF